METAIPYRPPVIAGARIRLRPYREDDLPAFFAVHADPEVMRYGSHPPWTRIEQAYPKFHSSLHDNAPDRQLCWVIAAADDRLIGGVALFRINAAQRLAEFGYALERASWGQGFAREAAALALGHAFDGLDLRRIEADIDPRNLASCRLAERLGFVREGLLRERWQVNGEISDTALYGLLARDWNAAGPRHRRRSGVSRDEAFP
ncbi:GNAT family N-acetyltransferase [Marilutibacter chinensis]|uniref:GNAT family N-acetyltransferase n=1 Tax=Marilutibacter chinensis TaxID=2912247 RepID=A0ABS9HWW4_9GAMM|nr:GNAT family N-acetyltransferase [Lysobacter chinensis]MCF7223371.1 GNAT family N-acetyltransferase [Lysobacter chinensis]